MTIRTNPHEPTCTPDFTQFCKTIGIELITNPNETTKPLLTILEGMYDLIVERTR